MITEQQIKDALIEAVEEVLGLPADEMRENFHLDLFENELIDSLGCVALMTEVEEKIDKQIDIAKMIPDDFTSLATMTEAILRII